jgi:uncharacterized cupin superfamily protein
MTEEARLEHTDYGLTPATEGWFVVDVPDAAWVTNEILGSACVFEGEGDDVSFPDVGYTIGVLQPGQAGGRYHREANQEDFLVLAGECILVIEGEERRLKAWDFVHCPPNTEHGFVGAGDGPCVIFMTGARTGWPKTGVVYPRLELALRHGVGVETETTSPAEAYAPFPKWQPGPPSDWNGLPWA